MTTGDRETFEIGCLACGRRRRIAGSSRDEVGVCPACGYVGWSYTDELGRDDRRPIRRNLERSSSGEPQEGTERS